MLSYTRAAAGISATIIVLVATPAPAPFYTPSESETSQRLEDQLTDIRRMPGVNEEAFRLARRTAAVWFYVGPCNGSTKKLNRDDYPSVAAVVQADPGSAYGAATLAAVAIFMRQDIYGRPKEEHTICRLCTGDKPGEMTVCRLESFQRARDRAQKLHDQQFWWGPGDTAPTRAPDMGAMLH
jgi:hypothetical protein